MVVENLVTIVVCLWKKDHKGTIEQKRVHIFLTDESGLTLGNWGPDVLRRQIFGAPTLFNVGESRADVIRCLIFEGRRHLTSNCNWSMLILYLMLGRELADVNFGVLITKISSIIFNIGYFVGKHWMGDIIGHFCASVYG